MERKGSSLLVAVPDEPTRDYLENEYAEVIARAVAALGILEIQFMMAGPSPYQSSSIGEQHGTVQENGVTGIP